MKRPQRTGVRLVASLAATLALAGCQGRLRADPTAARPAFPVRVHLPREGVSRHRSVELWVARPLGEPQRPLVLHLTGDAGRYGFDLTIFTALSRWGYPVATLASPDWIDTLADRVTSPQGLATDLALLSRAAAGAAGVAADAPIVLLGQSRGAGLAVEAAGEPSFRSRLLGIAILGLCPNEEFVHRGGQPSRPYQDLGRLHELPVEQIQSTRDHYMSAAAARNAVGPDSATRRLHAVEARGHSFGGNREGALDELRASLEALVQRAGSR